MGVAVVVVAEWLAQVLMPVDEPADVLMVGWLLAGVYVAADIAHGAVTVPYT
jgi:hypothetical protein